MRTLAPCSCAANAALNAAFPAPTTMTSATLSAIFPRSYRITLAHRAPTDATSGGRAQGCPHAGWHAPTRGRRFSDPARRIRGRFSRTSADLEDVQEGLAREEPALPLGLGLPPLDRAPRGFRHRVGGDDHDPVGVADDEIAGIDHGFADADGDVQPAAMAAQAGDQAAADGEHRQSVLDHLGEVANRAVGDDAVD